MRKLRRILCPVDASECSFGALRAALALAERFDARVHVLHAFHVPAYIQPGVLVWAAVGPRPLWQLAEEQARSEVEHFLSALSQTDRDRLDVVLEVGDPSSTIVEMARRRDSDLIVMGTHGRTGASRVVLGSVAERVVRLAICPVLVIPLAPALLASADQTSHAQAEHHPAASPEGASR